MMAWRLFGAMTLPNLMMTQLPMHTCIEKGYGLTAFAIESDEVGLKICLSVDGLFIVKFTRALKNRHIFINAFPCFVAFIYFLEDIIIQLANSYYQWWRHQMETFSALLVLCEGDPPVTGGFPSQRRVKLSFCVFFDTPLIRRLSK